MTWMNSWTHRILCLSTLLSMTLFKDVISLEKSKEKVNPRYEDFFFFFYDNDSFPKCTLWKKKQENMG